jgi:dTDP-glucose pyrophosphorylase
MNRLTAWKDLSIARGDTLRNAMNRMTDLGVQSLIVVDNDLLLGTLSDGDIRRAILSGAKLEVEIDGLFNSECRVVEPNENETQIKTIMNALGLHVLPEVTAQRHVVAVHTRIPIKAQELTKISVLIMAGGKGERLRPLTEKTPKPLVKIKDTALIEILINKLAQAGLRQLYISVHYLADELIDSIGDGARFGVSIQYLRERTPLGTAGSISLLPKTTDEHDLLICNSDLLHELDFRTLLEIHRESNSDLTVVGRVHQWTYPYGTLDVSGSKLRGLTEKPLREDFISAGIYVLGPKARKLVVGEESHIAMSDLILKAISKGLVCRVFEIQGYWRDVGNIESLQKAHEELWGKNWHSE